MSAVEGSARAPGRLGLVGLYVVIAYCSALIVRLPFTSIPRDRLRIGPFLLEGTQVFAALGVTAIIWVVMIWGLIRRRPWGRVFALFVFGGHIVLLIAGAFAWLSAWNHSIATGLVNRALATPTVVFQIMVWPTLRFLVPSAIAFFYVAKRRDLFHASSGPEAAVA